MRIAFAGNPNSGKTTMDNAVTGKSERVGNWAGVTVDMKVAPIKKQYARNRELLAVDLPGAYSLSPFTAEESVTRDYITEQKPDVLVNIVDATNLSRSLFFTTQLLELGIPMVVALNKSDLNEKKRNRIDGARLSQLLGCPVVETVSTNALGMEKVVEAAVARAGEPQEAPFRQDVLALTSKTAAEQADRERVFQKLVFAKNKSLPDSGLPESFLTTGTAFFTSREIRALQQGWSALHTD